MKITPNDIEYIKIKDDCVQQNFDKVKNIQDNSDFNDARLMLAILLLPTLSYMFVHEYPFRAFFIKFHDWSFFDFGIFEPHETIAILTSIGILFFTNMILKKIHELLFP